MADPDRHVEAGYTLVEVVVCVALLVAACVAALGVVPTLARASQGDVLRDAADAIGVATIARARAAVAYYPATGYSPNHAYALNAAASYTVSTRVHRIACKGNQIGADVPMKVDASYAAAGDVLTIAVHYPRNACDASAQDVVVLSAQLAPSALSPGTTVTTSIGDPSRQ